MQSVLVVEDDSIFAMALAKHLIGAGFVVETAADTFAALDMINARNYDMLLLDLAMPSGKPSGLSFARMVRYRRPSSRMIFVTGYPELADVVCQLPGKVFTKPVELDAIVSEIRSQLSH